MTSMLIRPWQQTYSIDIHWYSMAVLLFGRQELSGAFLHLSVWVQMAGLRLTSPCLVIATWYLHPASSSRHFLNNFNLWTFVCQGWWVQSGEGSAAFSHAWTQASNSLWLSCACSESAQENSAKHFTELPNGENAPSYSSTWLWRVPNLKTACMLTACLLMAWISCCWVFCWARSTCRCRCSCTLQALLSHIKKCLQFCWFLTNFTHSEDPGQWHDHHDSRTAHPSCTDRITASKASNSAELCSASLRASCSTRKAWAWGRQEERIWTKTGSNGCHITGWISMNIGCPHVTPWNPMKPLAWEASMESMLASIAPLQ